jgi:hypothetical protein
LLDNEGIVKISDFGLAYQKERDDESRDSVSIK